MSKNLSVFFLLFLSTFCFAQDSISITQINFEGNKKTKERVIRNELAIVEGDKFLKSELAQLITDNENRLKSVGLFNTATIESVEQGDKVTLNVQLVENWYLYPAPIFELGDRSFSAWWIEQNHELDRINYGVRGRHYNLTGNKDPLLVVAQFGYTKKFQGEYSFPYLFENKNIGFSSSIFFSSNKEIPYKTVGNKPQFYMHEDERVMLKRFRSSINVRMRPSVPTHHSFSIEFHRNTVDDFVLEELNSNYFLHGKNSLQFFMVNYDFQYDRRTNYLMPYTGHRFRFNLKKEGLGILKEQNALLVESVFEFYIPFIKRTQHEYKEQSNFGFGSKIVGKTNLIRSQQAFANNTGLGWGGDLVSGFDLYVMDGHDHILFTNHIKKQIIDFDYKVETLSFLPSQFKSINIQAHLRLNFDFAYINEPVYTDTNTLNNRWIYGFGPALDIILYNSYLFSFEYSFNDIGDRGLFLEARNAF